MKNLHGRQLRHKKESEKLSKEMEANRYISYVSTSDVKNYYQGSIPGAGRLQETQKTNSADQEKILSLCLSYLPYLEQMAETYGQIYLDPREASRKMAPYMNKDLISLRR